MSATVQEQRRRRKHKEKKMYKIRVRYKYHYYRTIETPDYGTYAEMYEKYKDTHVFFCADLPPEFTTTEYTTGLGQTRKMKQWQGYRLDSDHYSSHTESTLERYGLHKAWIDPQYKFEEKPVVLVFNAQDAIFGTVGTILGLVVAISIISDLTHESWHRRGVAHTHHGKTSDGRLKVKRSRGKVRRRKRWATRRDGRRYSY